MTDLNYRPRRASVTDLPSVGRARSGGLPKAAWSVVIAIVYLWLSYPKRLFGGVYFQPGLIVVSIVVVLALIADYRRWRLPRVPWPIAGFLLLCALSAYWSVSPPRTGMATILFAWLALLAACVVAQTDAATLTRGVSWGGVLIVVSNAVAFVLDPAEFGGHFVGSPYYGLQGNSNVVAYALLLTLTGSLARVPRHRAERIEAWVSLIVISAGLLLTGSVTGVVGGLILSLATGSLRLVRHLSPQRRRATLLGTGIAAAVGTIAIAARWEHFSLLLAKGSDLNGRLRIWNGILQSWQEVPLAGFGWGAFWEHGWEYDWLRLSRTPAFQHFRGDLMERWIPHGHNTVMDVLPELGILGVIGIVVIHAALAVRGVRRFTDGEIESTFALLVFTAVVLNGVTEPIMSTPVGWFTIVAAIAMAGPRGRFRPAGYRPPRRAASTATES